MSRFQILVGTFVSTLVLVWTAAGGSQPDLEPGKDGPGMKGPAADSLKLPVQPTIDLRHVDPENFSAALDKDPDKIFAFLRDHVAYEAYGGCLRGPQGTLLAMAGNSVDRAALLARMLEHAGEEVRFAHGTLAEQEARKLVLSMWVERPGLQPPQKNQEQSPALKAALELLANGVRRDFQLIREQLGGVDLREPVAQSSSLESMVKEAQDHWWVQSRREGKWIDWDPSFRDAEPGRSYASAASVNKLPQDLFHSATIRLQVEEYEVMAGGGEVKAKLREVLSHTAAAMELSGADLVLTHVPENWTAPAQDVQSALKSAIERTGGVKPVLLVGDDKWVTGQTFRQQPPPNRGVGGVGTLLGGAGTRKTTRIATAMWIEFEFLYPGGGKETARREVFDVIGMARRTAGAKLTADDVLAAVKNAAAGGVDQAVYSLFFTTGRVDAAHLAGLHDDLLSDKAEVGGPADARDLLRIVHIAFTTVSDALLARVGDPEQAPVLFYPDSPRVQVLEVSTRGNRERICLDLRRDTARAAVLDTQPSSVRFARIFRGVVAGTLERSVIEYATTSMETKTKSLATSISTSSVLERARLGEVPIVLLTEEMLGAEAKLPANTLARLRAELADGRLLVAPKQTVEIDDAARLAWWSIDPRSGETIAVTDEGLHQTSTEYHIVHNKAKGETTVVRLEYVGGELVGHEGRTFVMGSRAMGNFVREGLANGGRVFFQNIRIY